MRAKKGLKIVLLCFKKYLEEWFRKKRTESILLSSGKFYAEKFSNSIYIVTKLNCQCPKCKFLSWLDGSEIKIGVLLSSLSRSRYWINSIPLLVTKYFEYFLIAAWPELFNSMFIPNASHSLDLKSAYFSKFQKQFKT